MMSEGDTEKKGKDERDGTLWERQPRVSSACVLMVCDWAFLVVQQCARQGLRVRENVRESEGNLVKGEEGENEKRLRATK